ncbi:MAG: DUF3307 domain-containing protein [Solirubrobacteraceae bacterium]
MTWAGLFVVFFVSHQAGDYLLQTEWQATHKRGGLGRNADSRRALLSHTFTYSVAFVPALYWVSSRLGWNAVIIAAAISLPHLLQDDGRGLQAYARNVKGLDPYANHVVMALVDQSLHMVALFGAALLAYALI